MCRQTYAHGYTFLQSNTSYSTLLAHIFNYTMNNHCVSRKKITGFFQEMEMTDLMKSVLSPSIIAWTCLNRDGRRLAIVAIVLFCRKVENNKPFSNNRNIQLRVLSSDFVTGYCEAIIINHSNTSLSLLTITVERFRRSSYPSAVRQLNSEEFFASKIE